MVDPLDPFPPFAVLARCARDQVRAAVHLMHARRGCVLFEEGEPAESVFVVTTGRLTLQRRTCDGCAHTVCHVTDHGLACCVTVLDGGPYPASAVVSTDSTLCRLPCSLFRELLRNEPRFADAALTYLGSQLRQYVCGGAPAGDAGARIAARILSTANQFGRDVPLTRREIADMAGTSVETAIRETRAFEKRGWVRLGRGHIRVIDPDALRVRAGNPGTASLSSSTPLADVIQRDR